MMPNLDTANATVEFILGGIVQPLTFIESASVSQLGRFDGSVHYANGELCALGTVGLPRHDYQPRSLGTVDKHVAGTYAFGGLLHGEHFGHFVCESLCRLWYLSHSTQKIDGVIFYLRNPHNRVGAFVREMLDILCPGTAILFVQHTTSFEHLIVPQELKDGSYLVGHPLVRKMCDRLRVPTNSSPSSKIYVSRSKLTPGQGGLLCELDIERYLCDEGYIIIHPERMALRSQLEVYQNADCIVFADGSAVHLFALVASPDQRVFVIWRRQKYGIFNWQIKSFGGSHILGEPSIRQLWIPEETAPDMHHGQAMLDFEDLSMQLKEAGLIKSAPWTQPPAHHMESQLRSVIDHEKRSYTLADIDLR